MCSSNAGSNAGSNARLFPFGVGWGWGGGWCSRSERFRGGGGSPGGPRRRHYLPRLSVQRRARAGRRRAHQGGDRRGARAGRPVRPAEENSHVAARCARYAVVSAWAWAWAYCSPLFGGGVPEVVRGGACVQCATDPRVERCALHLCSPRLSVVLTLSICTRSHTQRFPSRRVFRHITALVAGFRLPTHPVGGGIVLFVTSWPRLAVTAGVTRGIVPVLAEAGVLAFSEGANSQIVPPEVRNRAGQGLNSGHYSAVSASSTTFSVRGDPMPLAMLVGCHREVNCNARRLSVCNHGCVLQELTLSFSNRVDGT